MKSETRFGVVVDVVKISTAFLIMAVLLILIWTEPVIVIYVAPVVFLLIGLLGFYICFSYRKIFPRWWILGLIMGVVYCAVLFLIVERLFLQAS